MRNLTSIYDLDYQELSHLFEEWGEPAYRVSQLWAGLYQQLWTTPSQFTNFPKLLRNELESSFSSLGQSNDSPPSFSKITPIRNIRSKDGETLKTLLSLNGGQQVEAVLMRYDKRRTLCISTQSGCAMGCVFCATGQMGFKRHLTRGEIIEQVLHYARILKQDREQVSNIVIMGMGEPFHNYDETMAAIDILNNPDGFSMGARRFTVSTVGIIPGIQRFTQEHRQVNLAISLHAANDDLRSKLLPINHKYPLDQLFTACVNYITETHRRISFEWALIQGVNDTQEQAELLIRRLEPFCLDGSLLCHVNVIPLNPTSKFSGTASSHQNALKFQNLLQAAGVPCTIRLRRGIEIQAGCGQLASNSIQ